MILLRSQEIYENLLECLCQNDIINKRYLLTRGIKTIPSNDEIQSFDHDWYEKHFVIPVRNILIKYSIVLSNDDKYIKLTNVHLPFIKCYEDLEIRKQAYDYISQVYNGNVPTYKESLQFENYIWRKDKRIKYVGMKKCIQYISEQKTVDVLSDKMSISDIWEWIDKFIIFIKENDNELLEQYSIIPNMNSEFVELNENLASSKEVPDNMIECIEELEIAWKSNHIHKNIKKFKSGIDHNIKYATSIIRNNLKEWSDKILTLISYIPNDNTDKEFVQKRNEIYDLCSKEFNDQIPNKKDGSLFPKELWNGIDDIVFKKLIEKVENQRNIGKIYNINYLKKFLNCVSEFYPSYKNHSIIPNQNDIFCKSDELYEDIQIPEIFKECMKNCFNYDIKNELIDNNLLSIKSLINGRKKYILDYIDNLRNYFQSYRISFENKQKASRYLIQIIPKETKDNKCEWQNEQRNLFNIYKIFIKNDIEYYEIENKYCDKGLWKDANEYICDEIISIIENCEDINELKSILNIENEDKDKIYEYLNILYKFRKEGIIVPNQYDQFCLLNDLYNEGITNIKMKKIELISEELKDIAKDLEYDVRKYLIHPKIERICKNNISEKEINEKIAKLMEKNNKNPNKRSDPNFKSVANCLIEYNFEKIRNNSLPDEIMYIFGKVYIANIINRLRELENPSIGDCKRWIWELIQNAKDSIVDQNDQEDRKSVDIELIIEGDKYIFKHNGSPFNKKTLPALLYKFTEGKSNNTESTGRFGTGFLTTHSLSKTVKISGYIKSENQIKIFEVTMFREGEEEDLLNGLNKTKNSYHEFDFETDSVPENERWTSYEYITKTERNKEAGKLGIQNFKENINKVMLFCPEISSIKLNDNGKIFTIKRGNLENNLTSGCEKLKLNINDNNEHYSRSFLYKRIEESNELLTERFKTDRNLRICCAIELDDSNNIFIDKSSPCLYCSLPLVGSEKHILPFIINSPDFEPDSERQSILLDGNEKNAKTDKISDQGINKMILLRSQEIYENLLECLCQNDIINKRYLLTRGIKTIPSNDEIRFFDHDWYEKRFVIPVRDILIKYPIVLSNDDKYIKLTNVHLPLVKCYEDLEIRKQAYDFISQVYNGNVPTYKESLQFENYIWREDERIKYIGMEECIQFLSTFKNMNTLSIRTTIPDVWKWINDYLSFIINNEKELLEQYSIIPNMNSEFVKLQHGIFTSIEVPDNMIECIDKLELPWKSNHVHKIIKSFNSILKDHDIKYAVFVINDNITEWSDKILTIISYIPNDNIDEDFVQKRNEIYDLCNEIFKDRMPNKMDGRLFPKELWNGIDEIVFDKLIEKAEIQGKIGEIYNIEYMKKLLNCVSKFYPFLYQHSIIPNKNGEFRYSYELYEDNQIPEIFKECMKNCFNYDIKNE